MLRVNRNTITVAVVMPRVDVVLHNRRIVMQQCGTARHVERACSPVLAVASVIPQAPVRQRGSHAWLQFFLVVPVRKIIGCVAPLFAAPRTFGGGGNRAGRVCCLNYFTEC